MIVVYKSSSLSVSFFSSPVCHQWSRRWDNTSDHINISHTFIISFLFHSHFFNSLAMCSLWDLWGSFQLSV